jgi:hypothetical protein
MSSIRYLTSGKGRTVPLLQYLYVPPSYVCFLATGATTLMEKKLIISCGKQLKVWRLTVNKTDGVIIRFAMKGIGSLFFLTKNFE